MAEKVTVFVTQRCVGDMLYLARKPEAGKHEIGGVLDVARVEGTPHFAVSGQKMIPQGGFTDHLFLSFDDAKLLDHCEEIGLLKEAFSFLPWGIWHSHGPAGVTFSDQDDKFFRKWAQRGPLVNLLVNAEGRIAARIDFKVGPTPKEAFHVTIPPSQVDIEVYDPATDTGALDKQFEECWEEVTRNNGPSWEPDRFKPSTVTYIDDDYGGWNRNGYRSSGDRDYWTGKRSTASHFPMGSIQAIARFYAGRDGRRRCIRCNESVVDCPCSVSEIEEWLIHEARTVVRRTTSGRFNAFKGGTTGWSLSKEAALKLLGCSEETFEATVVKQDPRFVWVFNNGRPYRRVDPAA